MELRVLRYFLTVAQEQSISRAAERLHITQPTLSRQLMELEEELGVKLFLRGRRSHTVTLTEPGRFLRQRAEEMLELAEKTESAFVASREVAGIVAIGAGETQAMRYAGRAMERVRLRHPKVSFRIESGDSFLVKDQLDQGLVDYGVVLGPVDEQRYERIPFPVKDVWGVLMRHDMPLAGQETVTSEDLLEQPLILPRQKTSMDALNQWFGRPGKSLQVVAMGNLIYNGSVLAAQGLGYAITLEGIINVSGDSPLCFRPMEPRLEADISLVWKKGQVFSRAAAVFLEEFQRVIEEDMS